MNDPTKPGKPPSVEGIVSRPSRFSVEETLERLKATIHSRNFTLFAQIDHEVGKKETGRCPGGNTTGEPRLGVCGGSPGCQNTSGHEQPGWLNGTGWFNLRKTLSQPASSRLLVHSLLE